MEGKIKYFDAEKQFGFIHADGIDYFFHCYNLDNKRDIPFIGQGMDVRFSESMGKKGPRAENIKMLGESRIAHDPLSEPFRTFKSKPPGRVDVHETSSWEITSEHRFQKGARELLIQRTHRLGANAVSHLVCERKGIKSKTRYIMKGVPCKVSQKDVKLKKATHPIDDIAFRVKRNAFIRLILASAFFGGLGYAGSLWHPLGWLLSLGAIAFWNETQWLKRRESTPRQRRRLNTVAGIKR